MKRTISIIVLALAVVWTVDAQSAQERFEEFSRKANEDYEKFRENALNRYESYMEQAWKEYEVFAGKQPDKTPKPVKQPTVSEEEKAAMLANGQGYEVTISQSETTDAWLENLRWEGSYLDQWINRGVDKLRKVDVRMPTALVTLSDIARERRKAIAERIRKLRSISIDYVAPSELRRMKREEAANKQLAENVTEDSDKTAGRNVLQKEEATETIKKDEEISAAEKVNPTVDFELYGLKLSIPAPGVEPQEIRINPNADALARITQVKNYWGKVRKMDLNPALEALTEISLLYSLGDWCTYKAVEQYAATWAKGCEGAKTIMTQYLMLNMGYDVRLAVSGDNVLLCLPFQQEVCEVSRIFQGEQPFYLYPEPTGSIFVVEIPKEERCDRMNLVQTHPISLPHDSRMFTLEYGGLYIAGNLNLNIIRMQQEIPLMDFHCYAASLYDDSLRLAIVKQLQKQLKGRSEEDAANALLHFVESGFKYKTDPDQFGPGVEKTFFFEEILYHPYCDCEDRSIFYSYLVKHVLGLDVVLVHFPGHACTAVAFTNPPSRRTGSYNYKGKRYYICDPTYVVSDVGMCHYSYSNVTPRFYEWYKVEEKEM